MIVFDSRMKMADLVAANHHLILVMQRFGIPLGFGEKRVKDVCEAAGVPVDFFLLVCNFYTFDGFWVDEGMLSVLDRQGMMDYLKASHRYYLEERLPHIGRHLHNIASRVDTKYGSVLERFLDDYQKEISAHFEMEERELFPLMMTGATEGDQLSSERFEESHGSLVDALSDLSPIVYKYLPGNVMPEETMELVFDILQLSSDLEKHALIEEKILIPYLRMVERRMA